jgi:hypothetical protein
MRWSICVRKRWTYRRSSWIVDGFEQRDVAIPISRPPPQHSTVVLSTLLVSLLFMRVALLVGAFDVLLLLVATLNRG